MSIACLPYARQPFKYADCSACVLLPLDTFQPLCKFLNVYDVVVSAVQTVVCALRVFGAVSALFALLYRLAQCRIYFVLVHCNHCVLVFAGVGILFYFAVFALKFQRCCIFFSLGCVYPSEKLSWLYGLYFAFSFSATFFFLFF